MAENNLTLSDINDQMDTEDFNGGVEYNYGGITCCVPQCYNNNKRNRDLLFYVIPAKKALLQKWLHAISRKGFKPSPYHRVCFAHLNGGKEII